ncbi:MAG: aldo/keto reductase [Candidatus Poribacteria bacterium]|nr:aldo/keto reductase [Candidatus Poribacteria bacterium]
MKYRILGQTGLTVSEIGLGAFPISGVQQQADGTRSGWTGTDDQQSIALIHRAEELGVNLIDSAESYGDGHSEEVTGRALQGRRDRWVVATKVSPNRGLDSTASDLPAQAKKRIFEAAEGSLKRLQTDYIDVYQLHATPLEGAMPGVMEALATLREQGKIRWYGISTNNRGAIDTLRKLGDIHVLQIGYNLLEHDADDLLHFAKQQNIGTLIRVPLAKGMLTGKYFQSSELPQEDVRYERFNRPESIDAFKKLPQLNFLAENTGRTMVQAALRFVLDHPGTSCAIAGAKNSQQIEQNVAAIDVPPLTESERQKAFAIADTIGTPNWSAN